MILPPSPQGGDGHRGPTAGLFSLAGNYIGIRCFAKAMKQRMLAVLTLFFVKICWELVA